MSRSTLYLGGSTLGAQVVPIDAGNGVYGASGSVLFKNCAAIPVDNTDLTNKKYVDDTITAVINNIEGLGNINPTALASITELVGDQTARGSILNNALVIQAIENTLGMDIADNLGPGATGEPVNTQFIPSLLRNPEKNNSVTDFSLNAFLTDVRRGQLDDKVPSVDQPTLADHLSNLYSINSANDDAIKDIISADGTLPTRNSFETIDGQLGDLYSKLTGDDTGDTQITTRESNTNVDAQVGNLYLQLAGNSNGATLTTRVGSENVDAQLGDLYYNLTGTSAGAGLSNRQTLNNVDAQLGNLYSQLTGDSGGLVATREGYSNVNSQLGDLYLKLVGDENGAALPARNTFETVDGQMGDLYSKLTGDETGDTTFTTREGNTNVDAQVGNLYLQLAGDSNGATLTTRVGSENVDAQLGDLYYNLTGSAEGAVLTTRETHANVDAQLGNLYSQLAGESTILTSRNSNTNVDGQLGNLYSQLAGASTTLTTRQSFTNVDAQFGNLYSQLTGDSVGSIVTRAGNTNVNSQLADLYNLISGSYNSFASGNLTSTGRYTGLYGANNSVDAQLGFLFLRLEQLYTYFLEQDLSTAPA